MITHEHFLNLIVRDPENARHRLVYADWLEEQGDPRAEFLRLQAEQIGHSIEEPLDRRIEFQYPDWWAILVSLAQPGHPFELGVYKERLPLREPLVHRGLVVTFASQFQSPDLAELRDDLTLLTSLPLPCCWTGASSEYIDPFLCEPPACEASCTARMILDAIQASRFRSEHIATLDAVEITWPGYHPRTANDEIHTDAARQYIFFGCEDLEHPIGSCDDLEAIETSLRSRLSHEALQAAVEGGKLWYILLHPQPEPHRPNLPMVLLFALGISKNSGKLIGVVTQQMCHNLCD